ncbi:MAG: hypothetical protein ABF649_18585 [Bacillus sp. (in: firmicutes)]
MLDNDGNILTSGKFPMLGLKWKIYDKQGTEIGILRTKFSLLAKKYEYEAYNRASFLIKVKSRNVFFIHSRYIRFKKLFSFIRL